jgi:hypothetical protein
MNQFVRVSVHGSLRAVLVLSLIVGGLGLQTASAEDPAMAKQLYMEARALMKEGRIRESLDKLKAAHEAFPDDAILVSIANRHLDLGEPEEAAQILSLIQSTKRAIKKQVRRLRRDIESQLSEPVVVKISADVAGSTVSIDSGAARELPAVVQLPRGSHQFVFSAPERADLTVEKVLKGSLEVPLVVSLSAMPGRYRVAVDPAESLGDTKIMVDGRTIILSPEERRVPVTEPRDLEPGPHKVSCIRGFDERADASLVVRTGEVSVATCYFEGGPAGSPLMDLDRKTMGWISAGSAAAALFGAIGYYVSYEKDLELYPAPRYKIDSTKPVASGLLAATSAGLGGLAYWLFTSDEE